MAIVRASNGRLMSNRTKMDAGVTANRVTAPLVRRSPASNKPGRNRANAAGAPTSTQGTNFVEVSAQLSRHSPQFRSRMVSHDPKLLISAPSARL
jgi:hypothetical protein